MLVRLKTGHRESLDELMAIVYDELHKMAHGQLARERANHTLNTTALVHEAYLKLVRLDRMQWQDRAHFMAIAGQAMRNILVDYAIRRKALKRGGGKENLPIDKVEVQADAATEEWLSFEEALQRLEKMDARQGKIVTYRFFGGLNIQETAEVLGISVATVNRDWSTARAWLNRALKDAS